MFLSNFGGFNWQIVDTISGKFVFCILLLSNNKPLKVVANTDACNFSFGVINLMLFFFAVDANNN